LLERKYQNQLDAKAQEYIHYAVDGGARMRELIDDLLEYARVESKGKEFTLVSMNDVTANALTFLKVRMKEAQAEIIVEPLPTIFADKSQKEWIMQNLIGNAVKFRGQEQSRIHISSSQGAREWTIAVKDNGIGLNMQYADKIFQIFQQLRGRDKYHGSGVGLAIAKKIVERHGGRIWVESEEGKGATFFFTIPLSLAVDSPKPQWF
jgi:light-regulated signal transduction histidine kinase (bacteriophytochrome)